MHQDTNLLFPVIEKYTSVDINMDLNAFYYKLGL